MLRRTKSRSSTDNNKNDKYDKKDTRSNKNSNPRVFNSRSSNTQDFKNSRNGDGKPKGGGANQHYERYMVQAQEAMTLGDPIAAEHYYQRADHWLRINNESRKNNAARGANECRQNVAGRDPKIIGGTLNESTSRAHSTVSSSNSLDALPSVLVQEKKDDEKSGSVLSKGSENSGSAVKAVDQKVGVSKRKSGPRKMCSSGSKISDNNSISTE